MKPIFYSSKEEIRNRILKNAEDFWNVKDVNDFDPLVKLIIEALGNELFNVSNDVKNLENRIFDKISRILAPDHLTSALPAHAIMHASPLDQESAISPYIQFLLKKNLPQDDERNKSKKTDIFFSSLHSVKVHQAEVRYIATGDTIYAIDQSDKTPLINTLPGFNLEQNTVYIALKGISNWMDLNKMNFFFDWRTYAVPQNTYDLLALGKWFFQDNAIPSYTERFMDEPLTGKSQAPFYNKQLLNLIKADVLQYYSNRFITLGDLNDVQISDPRQFPKIFSSVFQPASLHQLDANMTWLKVVFPASISQEMLNELHIYINAFPVVNKKLSQIKHRLKTMNNIIPVKTEALEQMLCIESLSDNKGNNYNEIPYTNENAKGDGSFSIRYGGTERFDTRNAKDLVDYLFELLRDEKAAFSAYGPDFLNAVLKNLEQNIALIEQKSRAALKAIKELPGYIVLKPIDEADIVFLDLWVTQAEDANHIGASNRLTINDNARLKAESIFLLTSTIGGRSRLSATNRVQAYKYGLTTADRIITKADVINFCKYELGNKIAGITLAKGVITNTMPNSGFIKTTDIIIEPAGRLKLTAQDWNELKDLTLAKLKLRSPMNIHYRILIKSEN